MAVDFLIRNRKPTVRFVRLSTVEPESQVHVFWNGTRASNGDGLPGGEGAIDYATPLAGPLPIWASGQPTLFGGPFGAGGFAEPGAMADPSIGFGAGPFGVGEFGLGGGYWSWQFPFVLRDGLYRVGLRIMDSLGNERQTPDVTLAVAVEAIPRPATNARLDAYDSQAQTLDLSWRHSPDVQPIA